MGMTPEQVQALAGSPAKISKAGLADHRMEWWTYTDGTKLTFSDGLLSDRTIGSPPAVPAR